LIDPKIRKAKEAKEVRDAKENESQELKTTSSIPSLPEIKTSGGSSKPSLNSPASLQPLSVNTPTPDSMYSTSSAKRLPSSAASTPRATTPNALSSPRVGQNSPTVDSPVRKVGGLLKIKSPSPKKNASTLSSKDLHEDPSSKSSITSISLGNGRESTPTATTKATATSTVSEKPRAKRKSEGPPSQTPRPNKKIAIDDDLFELARRFKDTYNEYAKLYAVLSKESKRPKGDVQRLLSMHKELESWKQRLWASQR
jgi:hypothetical protein